MREIKFRFWGLLEKSWLIDGRTETSIYDFAFKNGMNWNFITKKEALERVVVVQYTGLKDKNGKEIYEGDVLKHDSHKYLFEIKWYPNDAAWRFHRDDKGGMGMAGINESWEIIGNIYENPELIGVDKAWTK